MALGGGIMLASPRPQAAERPYTPRQPERRAFAARICRAQGPNCRVQVRPGAPRDLTGLGCVCE